MKALFCSLMMIASLHAAAQLPQAKYGDVVITEIMADPSPAVGLPAVEWIEIRNAGTAPLQLQGWRLATGSSVSGAFPSFVLGVDASVAVASGSAAAQLQAFGPALSIPSFPSLDNSSTTLSLLSKEGKTIHAIQYRQSWHSSIVKKEGGWSLEMIDHRFPCAGFNNWKSSEHPRGGTPGTINSVASSRADTVRPRLLRTYTIDSVTIIAVFSKSIDSAGATQPQRYRLDGLHPSSAKPITPLFDEVRLQFAQPLQRRKIYHLEAENITDCSGLSALGGKVAAGLPENPPAGGVVINEILFNPKTGGSDYVELYNKGPWIIDLAQLYLGGANASGSPQTPAVLSTRPWLFFPGEHFVLSEDTASVLRDFMVLNPAQLFSAPLPSLPDDEGRLYLFNHLGAPIDELLYVDDWHFPLLGQQEGVALERINPDAASVPGNWHSAAATAGWGTPTSRNSQWLRVDTLKTALYFEPLVISPNNDGQDDFLTIRYRSDEPGFVANILLFNSRGVLIRTLVRNGLMGRSGNWTWNGLGENGSSLPEGPYVLWVEIFNLQGKKKRWKEAVVLRRR